MEDVRTLLLLSAILILIGFSGVAFTGNFGDLSVVFSNFGLILFGIILLLVAVYLLHERDIKTHLKRFFLKKSDEATLAFVKSELMKIKNELSKINKITSRNANKINAKLQKMFKPLVPYKIYVSMYSNELLDAMNKILSFDKITSKNLSEFNLAVKKIKEELAEL